MEHKRKYTFYCQRCHQDWNSKLESPASCGNCKSKYWNIDINSKRTFVCRRKTCGHIWKSSLINRNPLKCPSCQNYLNPFKNSRVCIGKKIKVNGEDILRRVRISIDEYNRKERLKAELKEKLPPHIKRFMQSI